MITPIDCEAFLNLQSACFDVRSPFEYQDGAIINAWNLPLLDNENRKAIGICYKQKGKDAAIALGYSLLEPIKQGILDQLDSYQTGKAIKIYCARGGLRSQKMAEFLSENGFNVSVLKGGYKAYRNNVLKTISGFSNIMILRGNTGCGKTEILHQLRLKGEQVLDLENLANHKGSAFGSLGEEPQPTNARFCNLIFENIKHYDPEKRLWVESESVNIGKVGIPDELWKNMSQSNGIEIALPFEERVNYIVSTYGVFDRELLVDSVMKLSKRLGLKESNELCDKIRDNNLHDVVRRLLKYYDKGYTRSRDKTDCHNFVKFELEKIDACLNSEKLLQHLQKSV